MGQEPGLEQAEGKQEESAVRLLVPFYRAVSSLLRAAFLLAYLNGCYE